MNITTSGVRAAAVRVVGVGGPRHDVPVRANRNRHTCGCSLPSLDGHATHATHLLVEQALPDLLRAARKAHVKTPPAVDWDTYRASVRQVFLDAAAARGLPLDRELDPDEARELVLLVHGERSLAAIGQALAAAAR